MGFYEEGMDLREMREILNVLEMSVNDEENNILQCDIQQAIKESELDFMPNQDSFVLNSTMMSIHLNTSPCSSPELSSQKITFEADVHHAIDWVPPIEDWPHKHISDTNKSKLIIPQIKINDDILQPDIESYCENINNESENNNSLETSASSMHSNDTNCSSFSDNSSHIVVGPVSSRRINDSGLNTTHDIPNSSSANSSTDDNDDCDNANASKDSVDISSYNVEHEIVGPVSMRRINDSGVNISNDMAQFSFNNTFNEEAHNSFESIVNSMESSL
ncbi:hypothetical protein DOY81_004169 [Sarcophaga bullata]|nr:hypothetical protein DOY81_004169 [Sarcophaga bullata]